MANDTPDTSTGGRTTTTSNGVAHIAPGSAGIVPELLSCEQAAALAGCGTRTWWRWTRSGLAPAPVKIGIGLRPAVRYRRSEILRWIESGCLRVDGGHPDGL